MHDADIADSLYCLALACAKDLPDIPEKEFVRLIDRSKPMDQWEYTLKGRRPYPGEVSVYSFPQTWASTALGFGGIGGRALTTAQTTVCIEGSDAAVYFGRRLAYVVRGFNQAFMSDVASHSMEECGGQGRYR